MWIPSAFLFGSDVHEARRHQAWYRRSCHVTSHIPARRWPFHNPQTQRNYPRDCLTPDSPSPRAGPEGYPYGRGHQWGTRQNGAPRPLRGDGATNPGSFHPGGTLPRVFAVQVVPYCWETGSAMLMLRPAAHNTPWTLSWLDGWLDQDMFVSQT